ncbi:DUF7931 domain-containing protein [Chitinibacteraceae bacterium HSL-7]
MTAATFTPRRLERAADYPAALIELFGLARGELRLFENSFKECDLGSRACGEALSACFSRNRDFKVTLLMLDTSYIGAYCPRILQLRETWSHRFTMLRVNEKPALWHAGFAIADRDYYVKRHHFDWSAGEISDEPSVIAGLEEVFGQLLEYGEQDPAWNGIRL